MFNSNGFASFNITCNKNNFLVISLCRDINQWLEKSRNQSRKLGQLQFSCWWPFSGLTFLPSQYLTLPMIMYRGTLCVYFFIHEMGKFKSNSCPTVFGQVPVDGAYPLCLNSFAHFTTASTISSQGVRFPNTDGSPEILRQDKA